MEPPEEPVVPEEPDPPSAEERTTEAAAGAPAGDVDLDQLLDDPDAASG